MIQPILWQDNKLVLLDQTELPQKEIYLEIKHLDDLIDSIKNLAVRGAPLLGIAAAYGFYLGISTFSGHDFNAFHQKCLEVRAELEATRPTAVNLFKALEKQIQLVEKMKTRNIEEIKVKLIEQAKNLHEEDRILCDRIGEFGNSLISEGASILTHCNAGALATGGIGTALGVVYKAHISHKNIHVYVDETRPLLQGARLTAWELKENQIPATLICDNMAGALMKKNKVDLVIVGADRIAANGDTANKIGTYTLAVLCKHHKIPFYIAAPTTTFDPDIKDGKQIPIELRKGREVVRFKNETIAPEGINTYSPAFDVTPNQFITAFITDQGIIEAPFKNIITNFS